MKTLWASSCLLRSIRRGSAGWAWTDGDVLPSIEPQTPEVYAPLVSVAKAFFDLSGTLRTHSALMAAVLTGR